MVEAPGSEILHIRLAELQSEVVLFKLLLNIVWPIRDRFSFKQEVTAASYQWKPRQEDQENRRKQAGGKDINVFIATGWRFHDKTSTEWRIVSVHTTFSPSMCFYFCFYLDVEDVGLNNLAAWHAWRDATGFRQLAFGAIIRGFLRNPFRYWPSSKRFLRACFKTDARKNPKSEEKQKTWHLVPDLIKEYV